LVIIKKKLENVSDDFISGFSYNFLFLGGTNLLAIPTHFLDKRTANYLGDQPPKEPCLTLDFMYKYVAELHIDEERKENSRTEDRLSLTIIIFQKKRARFGTLGS